MSHTRDVEHSSPGPLAGGARRGEKYQFEYEFVSVVLCLFTPEI